MLENRSFDHMLGFMTRGGEFGDKRVDGLSGKECNPKNIKDPSKGTVCVNDLALDNCPYDPNHHYSATTERIFGCDFQKGTSGNGSGENPCIDHHNSSPNPAMNGFV